MTEPLDPLVIARLKETQARAFSKRNIEAQYASIAGYAQHTPEKAALREGQHTCVYCREPFWPRTRSTQKYCSAVCQYFNKQFGARRVRAA